MGITPDDRELLQHLQEQIASDMPWFYVGLDGPEWKCCSIARLEQAGILRRRTTGGWEIIIAATEAAGRPEQAAGPAPLRREASPPGKASPEAKRRQRVLAIAAAWRTHHGHESRYSSDPLTISAAEDASGVNRRTLKRAAAELLKCKERDAWGRYESFCQLPREFLRWLDTITDPGAALQQFAPASAASPRCTSCGDPSDSLAEWREERLCPGCYGQIEDGQT